MKIIKWLLLFGLVLSGCTSTPAEPEDTSLKVLCPSGCLLHLRFYPAMKRSLPNWQI